MTQKNSNKNTSQKQPAIDQNIQAQRPGLAEEGGKRPNKGQASNQKK